MTFVNAIIRLRDGWPREEFPDRTIALYAEYLGKLPEEHVCAAIDRLIARATFRPSIGEIATEAAERALALPSEEEAWIMAEGGKLRAAPEEVRVAADYIGGRHAIMTSANLTALRAQFRQAYRNLRESAIREYASTGDSRRALPSPWPSIEPANGTLAALPVSTRIRPRPIMARLSRRWAGRSLEPPTEEEKADAIAVLRDYDGGEFDPLYIEAERVFTEER